MTADFQSVAWNVVFTLTIMHLRQSDDLKLSQDKEETDGR